MKTLETCVTTFQEVKTMTKSVKEAICEAIAQKAIENGHMTFAISKQWLMLIQTM